MFRRVSVLLFPALPLVAGSLSGTWPAIVELPDGKYPVHLEFRQTAGRLTGECGLRPDFTWPLRNITLAGNALSFECQMTAAPALRFTASVNGEEASGNVKTGIASLSRPFTMRRTGPPARLPATWVPHNAARLPSLTDEFDRPDSMRMWKNLSEAEQWPERIEKSEVKDGVLAIVPGSGAWWAGYHGVYLFKEVAGDFVVTTRVKVTGRDGGEPKNIWTISGLLVRTPADGTAPREQRKENWIYLMTGRGPEEARVIDAKSTVNGINAWDVTPAQAGWYELRFARLGPLFVALCRPDGGQWMVRRRMWRADFPEAVQVGINVTSDFRLSASMPAAEYNAKLFPDRSAADSLTLFDYVRFAPAPEALNLLDRLRGRDIAGVSDDDLLALLAR